MNAIIHRLKGILIAIVALGLSASLTFGAQAPVAGYALGGSYEDNSGDEVGGDEEITEEEDTDEDTEEESAEDAGDNCLTDPRTLSEDDLAALKHGSIACWAAHQETPEGYDNHGAWVSEWAHTGKDADASATGKAKAEGKAQGKAKGLAKQQ